MAKVRVKIAVVVDLNGKYCGYGFTGADSQEPWVTVLECVDEGEARYWIEADLDIPEPVTITDVTVREAK